MSSSALGALLCGIIFFFLCNHVTVSGAFALDDIEEKTTKSNFDQETSNAVGKNVEANKAPCNSSEKCQNGGICEGNASTTFCRCKIGTGGDFCEYVEGCEDLHCDPRSSVCVFDEVAERTACRCTERNRIYDGMRNTCVVKDNCIELTIHGECNKPHEICEYGECRCKKGYLYSRDNETYTWACEAEGKCRETKITEECWRKNALCRSKPISKGYECHCDKGFVYTNGACTGLCDLQGNREKCARRNAVCELDDNYEPYCKCLPLMTTEDGPCDKLVDYSYLGKLSILKSSYEVKTDEREQNPKNTAAIDTTKLTKDLKQTMLYLYNSKFVDIRILRCDTNERFLECTVELHLDGQEADMSAITNPKFCYPLNEELCTVMGITILKRQKPREVFKKTNPCDSLVKDKVCGPSANCSSLNGNNFQCTCKEGFQTIGVYYPVASEETFVERCFDIDECQNPNVCPANATCLNTYGNYECICKEGFKKISTDSDPKMHGCVDICDPNPCLNQGECTKFSSHGYFTCRCQSPYTGFTCNETVSTVFIEAEHRAVAIVVTVLGMLFLITLIVAIVLCKKNMSLSKETL